MFRLSLALVAAAIVSAVAWADDGPPISGSVSTFARFDPAPSGPDDSFKDDAGRSLTVGDFRGKVVLLNFWAIWCAPCKGELASLDRLQAKLGTADFKVLPISIDDSGPALAFTYAQYGVSHLGIYVEKTDDFPVHMGLKGIPATFLIDRSGRLVGAIKGGTDWDTPEAVSLITYYLKSGQISPQSGIGLQEAATTDAAKRPTLGPSSH